MQADRTDARTERSSCDVTEALFAEFGGDLPLPLIASVVRESRWQLDAVPTASVIHHLEGHVRARLVTLWSTPPVCPTR